MSSFLHKCFEETDTLGLNLNQKKQVMRMLKEYDRMIESYREALERERYRPDDPHDEAFRLLYDKMGQATLRLVQSLDF